MQTLDALHERRTTIIGVPTGFRYLDAPLGGLQRSDLVILAARPGIGKTSFAVNVARHACAEGYRVLLFSLEMSRQQLGMRLLSMEAGIDQHRLRLGRIEDDEWAQVVAAIGTLSEGAFWMDDTAALPLSSLCSRARRLHAQEGIDLIIVDYLHLRFINWGVQLSYSDLYDIYALAETRHTSGYANWLHVARFGGLLAATVVDILEGCITFAER